MATSSLEVSDWRPMQGVHVPLPHVIQQDTSLALPYIKTSSLVLTDVAFCQAAVGLLSYLQMKYAPSRQVPLQQ